MKRVILTVGLLLSISSVAYAVPFLVCDHQQGVDYYVVTGLPSAINASHIPPDTTYGSSWT